MIRSTFGNLLGLVPVYLYSPIYILSSLVWSTYYVTIQSGLHIMSPYSLVYILCHHTVWSTYYVTIQSGLHLPSVQTGLHCAHLPHNLHRLAYIWPSLKSGLLSLFKVCSILGHQYSLVFYHNLYSLTYIWPPLQSGLLSQSVQSVLYIWPTVQSGLLS